MAIKQAETQTSSQRICSRNVRMSSNRSQSQSEAQGKKEMEARRERVPAESGQFSRHARNSLALLQGKQVCCVGTA